MALASLSESGSWRLAQPDADIRGWPLREAAGDELGTIVDLVIDTEHRQVETIKLDNGKQYPASDVTLGEDVAILAPSAGVEAGPSKEPVEGGGARRRDEAAPGTAGLASEGPGALAGFVDYDQQFRHHYHATYGDSSGNYTSYEPAYRHGHQFGSDAEYRHREYSAAAPELRQRYEAEHGEGTFEAVEEAVEHAYETVRSGQTTAAGVAVSGEPAGTGTSSTVGVADREDAFREHYRTSYGHKSGDYSEYRPAYHHGYRHGSLEELRERQYEEAEPDLRGHYEAEFGDGTFDEVRDAVEYGFQRARLGGTSTGE